MTDKNTIRELEEQARNTKLLMDRLNLAYIGLTTDEILHLLAREQTTNNKHEHHQFEDK